MKDAQKVMAATGECVQLIQDLIAGNDEASQLVKHHIRIHADKYPQLFKAL